MARLTACILVGKVDWIVTDSPVGLGIIFAPPKDRPLIREMVRHFRDRYRNIDIRLQRDPTRPYQTFGRSESEAESKSLDAHVDEVIASVLGKWRQPFEVIANEYAVQRILTHIEARKAYDDR